MLSPEDNMRLCQTGSGTPMGTAMRRFWIPILASDQLPIPDGDPVKVEIMGQKLVAFRNTEGVVGLIDRQCRHRNASLALGRVEKCGIRCLFHGWLFAPDGAVLEAPNVGDARITRNHRATTYPIREAGGMVWAYLGPKDLEPPFPHWRFFDAPAERRIIRTAVIDNANFVSFLEGLFDSAHVTLLHRDAFKRETEIDTHFATSFSSDVAAQSSPKIEAEATDFGFHYTAMRPTQTADGLKTEARITSFIAPFSCLLPGDHYLNVIVPINDTRTLHHFIWWSDDEEISRDPYREATLKFVGIDDAALHKLGLHYDTWHEPGKPTIDNDFNQDREAMRAGAYSGLPIFFPEDVAMITSCGPIRDRSQETLVPADAAIVFVYRTLLGLADAVERGEEPVYLNVDPTRILGTTGFVENGGTWRDLVPEHKALPPTSSPRVKVA
jgi:phthalate 4,5-dioxygenase